MDEWLGLIGWLGAVNLVGSTDGFEAVNGDDATSRTTLNKVSFVHRILKKL